MAASSILGSNKKKLRQNREKEAGAYSRTWWDEYQVGLIRWGRDWPPSRVGPTSHLVRHSCHHHILSTMSNINDDMWHAQAHTSPTPFVWWYQSIRFWNESIVSSDERQVRAMHLFTSNKMRVISLYLSLLSILSSPLWTSVYDEANGRRLLMQQSEWSI